MHKLFLEMLEASLGSGAISFGNGVTIGSGVSVAGVGGLGTGVGGTVSGGVGGVGLGCVSGGVGSAGLGLGVASFLPVGESTIQSHEIMQ